MKRDGIIYPRQRVFGVEQRQLVSSEALDLFEDQREMLAGLDAQFVLQRWHHVFHFGGGVVLERLGLSVLEEHLEHIGQQRYVRITAAESGHLYAPDESIIIC